MDPSPREQNAPPRNPGSRVYRRRLLETLRRGESPGRDAALVLMHQQLYGYARRYLGRQEGQADLQAESVVQSVLGRVLAEGLGKYRDDEHLRAGLHQRIKHLILDRKKKRRPGAMPRGEQDDVLEIPDDAPGPRTRVARREEERIARRQRRTFIDHCLSAPITKRQKSLLAAHIEGRSWQEIADAQNTTVGAAKKMMSEMRPKVLAHVLEPLRVVVDGRCWGLIEMHFIRRRSIETAASALGLSIAAAQGLLEREIRTAIVDHLGGSAALAVFERLQGYRKG